MSTLLLDLEGFEVRRHGTARGCEPVVRIMNSSGQVVQLNFSQFKELASELYKVIREDDIDEWLWQDLRRKP